MPSIFIPLVVALVLLSLLPHPAVSASSVLVYYTPSKVKLVVFYYGWLDSSNVEELNPSILVFSGLTGSESVHNKDIVQDMQKRGVDVYAYIHDGNTPVGLGSTFENQVVSQDSSCPDNLVSQWVSYIEGVIDNVTQTYPGVNIFLDEADPSYFGTTNPSDTCLIKFSDGISNIVRYIHSKGLKVMINGVRAYAPISDYYLWEGFYQTYENDNYVNDTSFFSETDNGNPYAWENGYGKYLWLKDHTAYNKTIALSFLPPSQIENNIAGYILATALGLAGWSVSPIDIYASGGSIYQPRNLPIGELVNEPVVDVNNSKVSFYTIQGEYELNVATGEYTIPSQLETVSFVPLIDGYRENSYTSLGISATGSSSSINDIYYAVSGGNLFLYIDASWSGQTSSVLLHIYIDNDSNTDTGFRGVNLQVGADLLLEVYSDSRVAQLFKYTGSGGGDWSWSLIAKLPVAVISDSNTRIELEIPLSYLSSSANMQVTTVDSSYSDDAETGVISVSDLTANTKPLYPPVLMNPTPYISGIPHLTYLAESRDNLTVTIDYHTGYATYLLTVPFPKIKAVIKNGDTPLPEGGGDEYWKILSTTGQLTVLEVRVHHASPVTLSIYATPVNVGSGTLGGSASVMHNTGIYMLSILVFMFLVLTRRK